MKRAQCQAWAEVSGDRCKKTVRRGYRYCWAHQGKLPYLITAIAGAIISLAVSSLWHCLVPTTESKQLEVLNRRPAFKAFLNGKAVRDETSIIVPVRSGVAVLQFSVQNVGTAPASDLSACIMYPAVFANVFPLGWKRLPPPDSFAHDRIVPQGEYAHYLVEGKSVAKGNGFSLPSIEIANPRPMRMDLTMWSGASEKVMAALNLSFESETSTITATQGQPLTEPRK